MSSIDAVSPIPAYQQIASQYRQKIASGELPPGTKLPSEREIAHIYGVSRPTARKAIMALQADGQVITVPARGAFVRERPVVRRLGLDLAERRGPRGYYAPQDEGLLPTQSQTLIRRAQVRTEVATALQIDPNEEVIIRERIISAEGKPLAKATSYFPRTVAAGTPIERLDTGPGGVYARLEEMGYQLHWFEVVAARPATVVEARDLELPAGVWVLRSFRTTYDQKNKPLEVMERICAADRVELAFTIWP